MSEKEAVKVRIDLALIHYPVLNKNREIIGSAVTNLDLHDIARAARTYGVDSLYVVTPYSDPCSPCMRWPASSPARLDLLGTV